MDTTCYTCDTVKDIDEAFKLLDDAFGDPSRLIDFKLKMLADMGQLPSADKRGGYKNQVSFYIKLQGIMEDLVSLGSCSCISQINITHIG